MCENGNRETDSPVIALETRARSSPYCHPTFDQKYPPAPYSNPKEAAWSLPPELKTSTPVEAIVKKVKQSGVEHIQPGHDPGLYLCEFIFFTSLLEAIKTQKPGQQRKLVNFIHLPPFEKNEFGEEPPKPYTFEELRSITLQLIWEIVQAS
jgi:hypothetical protein